MIEKNINLWKKKLLDTTRRNRLINYKRSNSSLHFIYPTFDNFFKIFDEKNVFIGCLFDVNEQDKSYYSILNNKIEKKDQYSYHELYPYIEAFNKKNKHIFLFTDSNLTDFNSRIYNIYKKSKLFLEENSINILHITLGSLKYLDYETNEFYYAPLLLLPVELSQNSIDTPYKLITNNTELLFNDTLIKMLEINYKLDLRYEFDNELSIKENYINYKSFILSKVHKSWSIVDEFSLSIFSFSKINMVHDIDTNIEKILANRFINLLSRDDTNYVGKELNEEDLNTLIKPNSFHQGLIADTSQQLAICKSAMGESFVLSGPPGTGKSQTITNIISVALGMGKKVLFVAEKKAALDVVYNNLNKVGLIGFTLPLHSELDKKVIVGDLYKTLLENQNEFILPIELINEVDNQFITNQEKLLNLQTSLLKKRSINKSLYELYGEYLSLTSYPDIIFKTPPLKFDDIKLALNNIFELHCFYSFSVSSNHFYGLNKRYLSLVDSMEFEKEIKEFNKFFISFLNKLNKQFDYLEEVDFTYYSYLEAIKLNNHLAKLKTIDKFLIQEMLDEKIDYSNEVNNINKVTLLNKRSSELKNELLNNYYEDVFSININLSYRVINKSQKLLTRIFSGAYHKVKKELKFYQKNKRKYKDLLNEVNAMYEINCNNIEVEATKINNPKYLSEVDVINYYYELACLFKSFKPKSTYIQTLTSFNKQVIFDELDNLISRLNTSFSLDLKLIEFKSLQNKFNLIENDYQNITTYINYNKCLDKCIELGLTDFLDKIKDYQNNYYEMFLKRVYLELIDEYQKEDSLVSEFNASTFRNIKNEFNLSIKYLYRLAKYKISNIVSLDVPLVEGLSGLNYEVLLLKREAAKLRKIKPLRIIFNEMPNLITQIKPVLMMSPLSVSSFLKDTNLEFDLVIFDEASQIKPESAICSIFRSKQVIICGDREQLPPTSFFENVDDDFDEEIASTYDSILDLGSSSLPTISLKWHYRSKFEDLIVPSNNYIYHDLITFPSASKPSLNEGLEFMFIEGVYHNRINLVEAKKVASMVFEHFKTNPQNSLGVVAFSETQQRAIELELIKLRRNDLSFEKYFNSDNFEPFFIKNIETVQGDERDTIILSIGYGPNKEGHISMNFGPLNKNGGYRRLNVSITRAKKNLKVITSLHSSDIDLTRTDASGVIFLKQFLEYSETKVTTNEVSEVSPFINDVYQNILKMGYNAVTNLGSSSYKIDIAVIDPINPNKFILGIECDGQTYLESNSIFDSDNLKEGVLEFRGWATYRLFSINYFNNKAMELENIKNCIENYSKQKIECRDFKVKTIKRKITNVDFEEYYDYQMHYNIHNKYKLQQILYSYTPIHTEEVNKLIPWFYDRQKISSVVINGFNEDLKRFTSIEKKGDFYFGINKEITFRISNREISHIHDLELKDGLLRLIQKIKIIREETLIQTLIEYCNYKKASEVIKNRIISILNELKSENIITYNNGLIEIK